jgi:osmotically-inducible protein OsmY
MAPTSASKAQFWTRCVRIRASRIPSFSERRAAVRDTRKVDGVDYVYDDVSVRLLDAAERSDAELRGMALQAIAWDTEAPTELIDVKVTDGWVTLRGGSAGSSRPTPPTRT